MLQNGLRNYKCTFCPITAAILFGGWRIADSSCSIRFSYKRKVYNRVVIHIDDSLIYTYYSMLQTFHIYPIVVHRLQRQRYNRSDSNSALSLEYK